MADIRIKDLTTTATTPAADDYVELDGATNGSRKLVLASYAASIAATRAPVDYAWLDGVMPNREIVSTLGPAGNVAGSAVTVGPLFWRNPTSNPTSIVYLFQISGVSQPNTGNTNQANMLACVITTAGSLWLRRNGADGTVDYQRVRYNDFVAAFPGQIIGLIVALTPGTTTPTIYLRTDTIGWRDASADFSLETAGTPPDWMDANLAATYFAQGYNLGAGEFRPGPIINRAWTQTDVDYYKAFGRVPPLDEFAGSRVQLVANSDFSSFSGTADDGIADTFTAWSSPPNITTDAMAGGGVRLTPTVDFVANGSGSNLFQQAIFASSLSRHIEIRFRARRAAGSTRNLTVWLRQVTALGSITFGELTESYATYRAVVTLPVGSNSSFAVAPSGSGTGSIELLWVEVRDVGTIASFDIGWTAQARGRHNRIHATITPGVTPMPARDAEVQIIEWEQAATGYALGVTGPHVFRDHVVDRVEVMPTTSTIPNVTLRRNATSGGTPIVNAASAGTQDQWTALTLTGGTRDGSALDYYHVTLSSAANVKIRMTLSKR